MGVFADFPVTFYPDEEADLREELDALRQELARKDEALGEIAHRYEQYAAGSIAQRLAATARAALAPALPPREEDVQDYVDALGGVEGWRDGDDVAVVVDYELSPKEEPA